MSWGCERVTEQRGCMCFFVIRFPLKIEITVIIIIILMIISIMADHQRAINEQQVQHLQGQRVQP